MTVAYLGLGANLGDARQTLKDAVVCLAQQHTITVLAKSSFYRTAPIDAGGDDYLNLVVKLETTMPVRHLLALCHKIEHQFGRERPFRNAPRTLDLDILLYGEHAIDEPDLIVPHPRMTERAFVLVPLVEIEPKLIIPQRGRADSFLAAVADQRIEKMKSACQCPMSNVAISAANPATDATTSATTTGDSEAGNAPKGGCR
ncbi:2-amino-4-hydroxy-6-hydroxymethyldihydropteridine diphosphokinase [Paraburkholderia sp. CNPSo 3157]|uniref:2-amino-4-hydroxy-6-hydroxymethyldihydropteridine pyrophosphokinase n=1 Tax=Paraburkholderia franconis TaxID=2654983 RepID=A0A7X1N5M4_9BURK|nr:2-amino-4-hydroxy-6-hydroxymethyldihydropteridine diphosphokinase [Paraburkholderia franconis]MPW15804.1 2-amino-4-hydroxy-6-hydroxymethyldihydropteridine diphosphokinase [Paraburkholderia franconis]